MAVHGSQKAFNQGQANGIVCYPRQYVVGADPDQHVVHCVDQEGMPLTLKVDIPARFLEAAKKRSDVVIPTLTALSETHRRARTPCYADPENGPGNPTGGIFLAEQVKALDASKGLYSCNWLSILRDINDAPAPRMGLGFLEINTLIPNTHNYEAIKLKLTRMNKRFAEVSLFKSQEIEEIDGLSVLEHLQERENMALQLYRDARQWFVAVDCQYHRLVAVDPSNELALKRTALELIDANSVNGMYGGVILRVVDESGQDRVVQMDAVRRMTHQYDYRSACVPSVDTLWNDFITKGKGSGWLKLMAQKGFRIEVIPTQRINGNKANERFKKEFDLGFSKQLKAFVDKEFHFYPHVSFAYQNAYLACPIAVRTADTREASSRSSGTLLLSNIHAYGKAIGNVLELDAKGEPTLKLSKRPRPFVKAAREVLAEQNYG